MKSYGSVWRVWTVRDVSMSGIGELVMSTLRNGLSETHPFSNGLGFWIGFQPMEVTVLTWHIGASCQGAFSKT